MSIWCWLKLQVLSFSKLLRHKLHISIFASADTNNLNIYTYLQQNKSFYRLVIDDMLYAVCNTKFGLVTQNKHAYQHRSILHPEIHPIPLIALIASVFDFDLLYCCLYPICYMLYMLSTSYMLYAILLSTGDAVMTVLGQCS